MATSPRRRRERAVASLPKVPSGIRGFDEITGGGLPRGRPTLVCGGPGCGKTLFGLEFLIRGATEHGEPGVFMSFEETAEDLAANVASLGFDLARLVARKKIAVDHVRVERREIEETGEYDLEGLFVRLQYAIETVGAKRVVLDTIESLFSGLPNPAVLRAELRRLFRWLKDRRLTVVLTGEKGDGALTREGLEEYVSDCVVVLDHRVAEGTSTRRLRIVKYRGSTHGTNEYPFLLDEDGISILPVTSLRLDHRAPTVRLSTGIPRLDAMLGGKGYYKGSTLLVTGSAGTGKTSVAALVTRAACERGERCLFFCSEESPDQLVRNMRSIGVDLGRYLADGRLEVIATRPTAHGLELHLMSVHRAVDRRRPALVVMDPITNLTRVGTPFEAQQMLTRLIDFLKVRGVTALLTNLTPGDGVDTESELGVSSLVDTWLMLQLVQVGGERNRALTVIKSRGLTHSNQAAEYRLGPRGLDLVDTYLGATGVLTGSARLAREAEDAALLATQAEAIAGRERERAHQRRVFEARLAALREEYEARDAELGRAIEDETRRRDQLGADRARMARSRHSFAGRNGAANGRGREGR